MKRSYNRRKAQKKQTTSQSTSWRSCWILLASVILLWGIMIGGKIGWSWYRNPNTLPFKTLKIIAAPIYIDHNILQNLVKQNMYGGFFQLNQIKLRNALLQNPWIKEVAIRRLFPATLIVKINEYTPVAYWQQNKILTQSGILISNNNHTKLALPHLSGPADAVKDVLNQYMFLTQQMNQLHFTISTLQLSPRRAWRMRLQNGLTIVIGRNDIVSRIQRLIKIYPKIIADHGGEMQRIDLRYPNGMAVQWAHALTHIY